MKVIERMTVEHEGNCEITFIRIDPEDLQQTLATILEVLMDLSWLSKFDEDYIKASYAQRANETITDIKNKFATSIDDKITKEAGEYVVSELARESLQSQLNYLHVPLAELLGMLLSPLDFSAWLSRLVTGFRALPDALLLAYFISFRIPTQGKYGRTQHSSRPNDST